MKKQHFFSVFFIIPAVFMLFVSFLAAKETPPLLSPHLLEPYGLTRAWFNQVGINPNRNKILYAMVEGGTMFVISDDAKLHVIDAETGKSLWMRTLGNREMIFQEPAVNSRMVTVLNGLELFVFDRRNGKLLLQTPLPGAASAASEMSENYVYVPMMGGRIVVFPLEDALGPKMEEEGGPGATASPVAGEDGTKEQEKNAETEGDDPVLANLVQKFAEVKQSILAEPEPPKKEPEIFLQKAIGIPMLNLSFGNVLVKPLLSTQLIVYNKRHRVTEHRESITWITDRGFLFVAGISSLSRELFELRYMVDSSSQTYYLGSDRIARKEWLDNKELTARPTINQCMPPCTLLKDKDSESQVVQGSKVPTFTVTGNKEGYVFAIKEAGEVVWQFAARGPIIEQIAIIGTDVYCPTSTGGIHALDLFTGKEKWYTPDICQFVAASKNRIYSRDRRSRLVIQDRKTGVPIDSFDARQFDRFLFNLETDRIYVVNDTGLIQCLHERQPQTLDAIQDNKPQPIRHRLSCQQYVDTLSGQQPPYLYWLDNKKQAETEENAETTATPQNETDKDNSDGNNSGEE